MPLPHGLDRPRRSLRLPGHNYGWDGTYFVTICAHGHVCRFGEVERDGVRLNRHGRLVASAWRTIPRHFPGVALDSWVVMPNHLHGIVKLAGLGDPDIGIALLASRSTYGNDHRHSMPAPH